MRTPISTLLLIASVIFSYQATADTCEQNVVLMGYWPPTNNMLRQWSTNPEQNPQGWQGQNWRGLGYNVYAFFPEFPPDGDPTNNPIGSLGSVGSQSSDLRVDFQDTSRDFWRIVDAYQPIILMTTSRGGTIGWEIEAVEGGHGAERPAGSDPAQDWRSDDHGQETLPTEASTDPRSWNAINTYRLQQVDSKLPLQEILNAASALQLTSVAIDQQGTSGNYLSGFLGLHGLAYNLAYPSNKSAGHIHVGGEVKAEHAVKLMETSLEVVLKKYPSEKPSKAAKCIPLG